MSVQERRAKSVGVANIPVEIIDPRNELVPALRELLSRGLSDEVLKSCVRVGDFLRFTGGLKSKLVGGVRIDFHAVMKVGRANEAASHAALMGLVNSLRPRTFPLVLQAVELRDDRSLLLMENLRGYVPLLRKVYRESASRAEIEGILLKVFDALRTIHRITPQDTSLLAGVEIKKEPFYSRIVEKIEAVICADGELEVIMKNPGWVMGMQCPSGRVLLERAQRVCKEVAERVPVRLVHGDPHLANVMVLKSKKPAYRVRLIDPNPEIGFSQPIYDVGKLMHWAEAVGWCRVCPGKCRAQWKRAPVGSTWHLDAWVEEVATAAENRRALVESQVGSFANNYRETYGAEFTSILSLSIASAHLGLAALLNAPGEHQTRRFVFAHALRQLSRV